MMLRPELERRLESDANCRNQMMASYFLVAILATTYFVVISLHSIKALNANKLWQKFHSVFEQTLNTFLDSSLIFSISMLLAAIYRFASAAQRPDGEDNTFVYYLVNTVTMSIFSVFPPMILQFTARRLRRRGIRAFLWFLVITFVITVTILYYRWRGPRAITRFFTDETRLNNLINFHIGQTLWLFLCDLTETHVIEALDRAIITAQVVLGLNLPCWIYLLFTIRDAQQDDEPHRSAKKGCFHSEAWKKYGKLVRGLNIVLCCAIMWLLLGTFKSIADRLADAMWPNTKDRRWSIGQVLALATFAPLIIDIITIALGKCFFKTDLPVIPTSSSTCLLLYITNFCQKQMNREGHWKGSSQEGSGLLKQNNRQQQQKKKI